MSPLSMPLQPAFATLGSGALPKPLLRAAPVGVSPAVPPAWEPLQQPSAAGGAANGGAALGGLGLGGVGLFALRLRALPRSSTAASCSSSSSSARRQQRRRGRGVQLARAAQGQSTASIEEEIAALEAEAAKLRAGASELQAIKVEGVLEERKRWFRVFDVDSSGGIDAAEIKMGMKEFNGTELDESRAAQLLQAHDANKSGVLELDEFDPSRLHTTLEQIKSEEQKGEETARAEKAVTLEKERQEEEITTYYTKLPGNQDVGIVTRLVSVMAYLLPLVDTVRFGLPLAVVEPALQPLFALLIPVCQLFASIPLGTLIVFIGFQALRANTELPALMRYNFGQSIMLDIALFIPSIIVGTGLVPLSFNMYDAPTNEAVIFSALTFLPIMGCILYSMICNITGVAPRGIPWISESAEMGMGMVPPSRLKEMQEQEEKK
mmetsp:Transcript_34522/g.99119  ORF Transcript_34522/g.99119 Transcript_34522/m.99119 type:complete len:436 (-) Transcript_34522:213-1520(-)